MSFIVNTFASLPGHILGIDPVIVAVTVAMLVLLAGAVVVYRRGFALPGRPARYVARHRPAAARQPQA